MRLRIEVELDYTLPRPADVLLQVEAAATATQRIEAERLTVWADTPLRAVPGEDGIGQRCWVRAEGRLLARYTARVWVERPPITLDRLGVTALRDVPGPLIGYLLPSRYCPSDRLEGFVKRAFGGLAGGPLAAALAAWVAEKLDYDGAESTGDTTALDTFASRQGVCRDYAHLLVALARAGGIPARCASAYAPGVEPPDFHAVAQLWLDGAWHLVDATGMARAEELAVVAVGRDATDIAFMTIWGRATLNRQRVRVRRLEER